MRVAKDAVDGLYGPPCTPCASASSSSSEGPQLSSARRVVAGGLGMQNKEGFATLYPLAKVMGAGLFLPCSFSFLPFSQCLFSFLCAWMNSCGRVTGGGGARVLW